MAAAGDPYITSPDKVTTNEAQKLLLGVRSATCRESRPPRNCSDRRRGGGWEGRVRKLVRQKDDGYDGTSDLSRHCLFSQLSAATTDSTICLASGRVQSDTIGAVPRPEMLSISSSRLVLPARFLIQRAAPET